MSQSEKQLVKSSSSFFENKQYAKAIDGYRQLLSNDLKNIEYNYCYGVCLFYTDNPKSSETYFNYILEQSQFPSEVFYFKGRLYHLNYEFDKAIEMYTNYVGLKTKKSAGFDAAVEIQRCQNAKELLKSPRAIQVVRHDQKNTEDYFSAYLFDSINYKLYSQEDFGKKYNAKRGFSPKYVFKRGMKYRFFASYSNDFQSGKDIFYQKKNKNNDWEVPQRLSLDVNTLLDEDFPFYDERTGYLYFSSTGHNSMGGYDLFRTKFSIESLEAQKVENLNFPYSSTANDFLFVPNLPSDNVIFTTDRNQDIGGLTVVEARFNVPVLSSLLASLYFEDKIDPQNSAALFFVTNQLSKEKFGPFNTSKDGSLYFIVPVPGAYLIEAKIDGSDLIFLDTIDIPPHVEGFEFEVSATYQMNDSRESIAYKQNLIQISDMVLDIESIELHEFEKLMVNTKTIEAAQNRAIAMDSKPMSDAELDSLIVNYVDLELELQDQIRQKIKLTENINELYSKNDEVDRKIDFTINQNIDNTVEEVDSLNPILYDLLIDRKIVVSSLIDQKEYNADIADLNVLQDLYSELKEFNKHVAAMQEAGYKDSLSLKFRSTAINANIIDKSSALPEKLRTELTVMESDQTANQARIDVKKSELKAFGRQKTELETKLTSVSDSQGWSILSDSIQVVEQRIRDADKDLRLLNEKNEIIEGQLIYAREALLNITLIDADGNDLENKLADLNRPINVDKYASAELYTRDKAEASRSLTMLKRNQNAARVRVRSSALSKSTQDTIMLVSEYEHIKALNQFGDQEDLVAENQVNILIQDSESIINSLSTSALAQNSQLVLAQSFFDKEGSNESKQLKLKQSELNANSEVTNQDEQTPERSIQDSKGSNTETKNSILVSNSVDKRNEKNKQINANITPQDSDQAIDYSIYALANKAVNSSQDKFDSQIFKNGNIDTIQSNPKKDIDEFQSSKDDSNINGVKELIKDNNSSPDDKTFQNNQDEEHIALSDKGAQENNKNNLDVEASSKEDDNDDLIKVSRSDEKVKDDATIIKDEEIDLLSNLDSDNRVEPVEESNKQSVLDNGVDVNLSNDILSDSIKDNSKENIAFERHNNSLNAPTSQQGESSNFKEESVEEFRAELKNTTETDSNFNLKHNAIDPAEVDEKNIPMQNPSVQLANDDVSPGVMNEPSQKNKNEQRVSAEITSQFNVVENEIDSSGETAVMNQQENVPSIKDDSDRAISDVEIASEMINSEGGAQEVESTQKIASKSIRTEETKNLSNPEMLLRENDLIASQSASLEDKKVLDNLNQNPDISTASNDENGIEIKSQPVNEFLNARLETLRFDINELQTPEFSESVKLLTDLVLDAEIELNKENSEPEPKRKKDLDAEANRREVQEQRLAYFQNELDLELTNQNIQNKYRRLKSILPGVQFQTVDNLNAQLLEIEIKEQDLLVGLSRATSQNEMNMFNKLIQANRSRKLIIEEELRDMQSFERNELRVTSRAVNEDEIASIIASESYLSYVERRQRLQEANNLMNQLKSNNRDAMMDFDASLRSSDNVKSLTEEQKQMVKEIRQLQQAIVYLEEEVKLRSSSLDLETASAKHEYLYQNAVNPSIISNKLRTLPSSKELSDIQLAMRVLVENKNAITSVKGVSDNSMVSGEKIINSSVTIEEAANVMENISNPLQDFSNLEGKNIVSEDIFSESELNAALLQIKNLLLVLESENYKSYVQDRILANLLAMELKGLVDISLSSSSSSKSLMKDSSHKEAKAELALKSAIDAQIIRNTDKKPNMNLAESELEITFNYVNEKKLSLIRSKLENVMERIGSYDSSVVYEALLREEFMEPVDETTASLQKSLESLDLVDYSESELIQSDFTVLKEEVISNNNEVFRIGNSNPSGLNFRVQVGAFRRPVRQDVYREFTPVSGQTLENGLIVYMAGYFNNSTNALAAQKQIRSFGYSDAFIVAYCNDERLAFWKGKEYEKNGACIAKGNNRFFARNNSIKSQDDNEISENNTVGSTETITGVSKVESDIKLPLTSTGFSELTSESVPSNQGQSEKGNTVNQTVNKYTNIQEVQAGRRVGGINVSGLFYSVQVGAFNRKIRGNELSQIRELDFYEFSGLYRYSSGKFLTITEARLRRTEVINNGISDAFLVVFYNGKRITMQEARDLLEVNGSSVLYNNQKQVNRTISRTNLAADKTISGSNDIPDPISTNKLPKITKEIPTKTKLAQNRPAQKHTIKIIDKAKLPSEKMIIYSLETDSLDKNSIERLNRVGVFHFNQDSSKIKSQAFETSSINSMLSFYTNGMQIEQFDSDLFIIHTIKINAIMDGAFGDWLIRSKRTIGFTRLSKDIYLNFYLTSEAEKDLLMIELDELLNN